VQNLSPLNTGFSGSISDFALTNYGSPGSLTEESNTAYYYAAIDAGAVPGTGSAHKTATVTAFKSNGTSGANTNDFYAYSGASQNCSGITGKSRRKLGEPVPLVLLLQLDTEIVADTTAASELLNRSTLLIHSQDHNFAGCWFSRPIDLSADGGNPAFWMLQKTAAGACNLVLRRVSGELATYHKKTPKKNGSFPIRLTFQKKGSGGKKFKKWPKSVTIVLAP
jgi:hypothetical protein